VADDDRYRLAPLRDARSRDERVRRGDLAAAVGDAKHHDAAVAAAQARVAAGRTALAAAIAARTALGRATARELASAERFIDRRRREVARAVGEQLRAEAARDAGDASVDLARRTLARARADREVIDRHFAAWRDRRRKLADRRED
jgi:hypothetical protein